mgnify:CR=1 FL=1
MNTRVLLADDHGIVLDGVHAVLEENLEIEVIGKATDGRQAIQLAREQLPDIVVMDITMPDMSGIEATRLITSEHPAVKVLCLSMHADRGFVMAALEAGASGYVLNDSAKAELHRAICTVTEDQVYLSPGIAGMVVDAARSKTTANGCSDLALLTDREREVLQLIAEGYTNKQIGEILNISIKTVQVHRTNMMKKLDLHDRGELIKYAIQKKIIEI